MYTTDQFRRCREDVAAIERREGRLIAVVAVTLGAAQLWFINWAGTNLGDEVKVRAAYSVFLVYMGIVMALVWRFGRRREAARPRCPQCGAVLKGASERTAFETGKCDQCGGQVIV